MLRIILNCSSTLFTKAGLCNQAQSTLAWLVSPASLLWGIPSLLHSEARVTNQLLPTPGIYVGSGIQTSFSLLGSKHFNY